MGIRLLDIARLLDGHLIGDGDARVAGAATIRDVQSGEITLADNPKHIAAASNSKAVAVLVGTNLTVPGKPCIQVDDVHASFAKIVSLFRPQRISQVSGISPQAAVSSSARISSDAVILPFAFIGDDVTIGPKTIVHSGCRILAGCRVGESCTLFPNVVLYEDSVVGNRVIIHANAVIGAYGFGYQCVQGHHQLSAQLGNVVIGDDVEIGAGTTIDRGTYGSTSIGEGTKIDNQVMIAHNCKIGRHNLLCSQVGIAGSCSTGDYVVMAGQVGIKDHINIGDRSVLGAKAGVMRDIPPNSTFLGIPATPEREQMHILAAVSKLPDMRRQLRAMEQQLAALSLTMKPKSEAA